MALALGPCVRAVLTAARRAFLALVGVIALATAASGEGTWVLWEESNELHTFVRTPDNRVRSVHPTMEDCIKAIDAEWQRTVAAWPAPSSGFNRLGPTSAIMMMTYGTTTYIVTYTCLPDTMRPPS